MTAAVPRPSPARLCLSPFDERWAETVCAWIRSDEELLWLAPGTPPPLTPQKLLDWGHEREQRFLLRDREARPSWTSSGPANRGAFDAAPCGYCELNYLPASRTQMWVGHFLLDPAVRGRGWGSAFAAAILALAFDRHAAEEVVLLVFPENAGAIACYQRAGFLTAGEETQRFEHPPYQHRFLRMSVRADRFRRLHPLGGGAGLAPVDRCGV